MENIIADIIDYLCSPMFLISIAILIVSAVILGIARRIAKRMVKSSNEADNGSKAKLIQTIYSIIKYVLIFLLIIMILQVNGVNVSAMITGFGVAGIVVGLALNSAIGNIIMGIHIVIDRFFKIGDVVKLDGKLYEVVQMSFQTTKMRNIETDGIRSVSNYLLNQVEVMGDAFAADILLSRQADHAKIDAFLQKCVEDMAGIEGLSDPKIAGLQGIDAGGNTYRLAYRCHPVNSLGIKRKINAILERNLLESDLEIPLDALEVRAIE